MNKSRESSVNYYYATRGLDIEIRNISADTVSTEDITIHDIPSVDREDESWARTVEAIANARQEHGVGYVMIPPSSDADGASEGTLEVYHFPWGGNSDNPVGAYELAIYARTHPNSTILAIDSPAVGASRRLSSRVSREIARSGSYISYGEVAVNALRSIFLDYDKRIISGASQGARRAIGITASLGEILQLPVHELHLLDPVGSHSQTVKELMKAFARLEGKHTNKYLEASPDQLAVEAQREIGSLKRLPHVLGKFVLRGGALNQMVREPQAMAKAGLANDLARSLSNIEEIVIINSPEKSELTRPDYVLEILRMLAAQQPPGQERPLLQQRVLKGQTHAMVAGHPGVLAMLLSRLL